MRVFMPSTTNSHIPKCIPAPTVRHATNVILSVFPHGPNPVAANSRYSSNVARNNIETNKTANARVACQARNPIQPGPCAFPRKARTSPKTSRAIHPTMKMAIRSIARRKKQDTKRRWRGMNDVANSIRRLSNRRQVQGILQESEECGSKQR